MHTLLLLTFSPYRIMVTHSLVNLPDMDEILWIESGNRVERGTYEQLMAKKTSFAQFVETVSEKGAQLKEIENSGNTAKEDSKRTQSDDGHKRNGVNWKEEANSEGGRMIKEEKMKEGGVGFKIYFQYLKAMG